MHQDHEGRGVGRLPSSYVLAVIEVRAFVNLPLLGPPAKVAVDRQPLATECARFSPAPARSLAIGRTMIPAAQDWYCDRPPQRRQVALDHLLDFVAQFVTRNKDRGLSKGARIRDVVQPQSDGQSSMPIPIPRALVMRGPLHRFLCLPETWRAPDEQALK